MTVSVLLFGPQAMLAGQQEIEITVAEESPTAGNVLAALEAAEPKLAPSLRTSRLAVNHEFADANQPIQPGDEIALVGMVSGG